MCEDAERDLPRPRRRRVLAERRPEPPFVAAEHALRVPALAVERCRERPAQRATARGARPAAPTTPRIERDHDVGNTEILMTQSVMGLGIVGCIGQDRVQREQRGRLPESGREIGRVIGRAFAQRHPEDQVRVRVRRHRDFRPAAALVRPARVAVGAANAVMGADVPDLESRGIDGRDRCRIKQPRVLGSGDDALLGAAKGPPFSASTRSRRAA